MMNLLLDKIEIEKQSSMLQHWQREAFRAFEDKMTNIEHPFPCIPATLGFKLNHLRYAFIEDVRTEESAHVLATLLKNYGTISRDTGNFASFIVFFKPNSTVRKTIAEYEKVFWDLMNKVSELDEKSWPDHIPKNPHHRYWEFCFNEEPYFIYCATPEHTLRKSRSFPVFMLAITPRWVLHHFHSSHPHADKIKSQIRERLINYDQTAPHPDLKWYGHQDNLEWKQYFIRDDQTTLSACPFKHHVEKKNS
jgi:FPC/CPF motif-containing protein YcgG